MIPLSPQDVSQTWLKSVLSQATKKETIIVKSLTSHQNKGGVLSCIFKVFQCLPTLNLAEILKGQTAAALLPAGRQGQARLIVS